MRSAQQGFGSLRRSTQQGFTLQRRSAQQGFTLSRRSAQQGFTLIELLVALSIFATLSAAGVMLLGNAVSAQGQIAEKLEEQGGMLRVAALLDQDMGQAVPRISRTESGLLAPVFFAREPSQNAAFLHFVRSGWANLDDAPRANVQKVEYWLRDGKLERRTYPMLDGAQGNEAAVLIDDVSAITLGFRDATGVWADEWQQADPAAMPVAARITITRSGEAPLTLMFIVGTGDADTPKGPEGAGRQNIDG